MTQRLQHGPTAALPLSAGEAPCQRKLWEAVQRLTREQLGLEIMKLLDALQQQGAVEPPRSETVSDQEKTEAWFQILAAAHRGQPRPGPYYGRCGTDGPAPCCTRPAARLPSEPKARRSAGHPASRPTSWQGESVPPTPLNPKPGPPTSLGAG